MNDAIPPLPAASQARDSAVAQARDARILARRKRIQERLAALREGDVTGALHLRCCLQDEA